jgi:hypothetical protein
MPTYIYSNSIDFSSYAMDQYYHINNITIYNQSSEQCSLSDPQCKALNIPLSTQTSGLNDTCLSDSFTAASCCSLHTEGYFANISSASENSWTAFLSDLIDGTVSLNSDLYVINVLV